MRQPAGSYISAPSARDPFKNAGHVRSHQKGEPSHAPDPAVVSTRPLMLAAAGSGAEPSGSPPLATEAVTGRASAPDR